MLRKKLLLSDCRSYFQSWKCSYSSATNTTSVQKSALNIQTEPLPLAADQLNLLSKKRLSASEFDYFINKLRPNTDQNLELTEKLYNLRQSAEATNLHESVSQSVIKYFVEEDNIEELLLILRKRLDYGVFVDKFTGWYLLNMLLERQDYYSATQIATELMLQEDLENELIAALSIKSCYQYLLNCDGQIKQPVDETAADNAAAEADEPEKKVRVKFLRNFSEDDKKEKQLSYLIGKTLLKSSTKGSVGLQANTKLLGLLLCQHNEELIEFLKIGSHLLFKETINLCQKLLQNQEKPATAPAPELLDAFDAALAVAKTDTIAEKLNEFLQIAAASEEEKLFEIQKQQQIKWQIEREQKLQEELKELRNQIRQEDIKQILDEFEKNKQKLWFFSSEDQLDLEIFKKIKIYPKRWFGKKKKPRAIDDNYIPPEIVRK